METHCKCGGIFKKGIAIVNELIQIESYDNAAETYCGIVFAKGPKTKIITVWKCSDCGHSHT